MTMETIRSAMLLFTQAALKVLSQHAITNGLPLFLEQRVDFTSKSGLSAPWFHVPSYRHFISLHASVLRTLPEASQIIDLLREAKIIEPLQIVDNENRPLTPSKEQLDSHIYEKLSGFLGGYVEAFDSFEYSQDEFELSYNDFLQTWTSRNVPHQVIIPLLFFSSEKYPVDLGNDLSIVELSAENKSALWKHSPFDAPNLSAMHLADTEAAVLGHYFAPSATTSGSRIPQSGSQVVLALRILNPGDVFPGAYYDVRLSRDNARSYGAGLLDSWRPLPRSPTRYFLAGADHDRLRSILGALERHRISGLGVALRRFEMTYRRSSPEDQIIDLTIGLESTLLHDVRDELKFRLALRGAALLSHVFPPAESVKLLRALYDIRSGIVHGGKSLQDYAKPSGIAGYALQDFMPTLLNWYRQMLQHLLQLLDSGASLKTIIDAVDDTVITALDHRTATEST